LEVNPDPVPQERRFYELFRLQGELVGDSLAELSKTLLEGRSRHARLRELELACDDVTAEVYDLAQRTLASPFEHGDVLALASALDDVVDLAEEVGEKLELYRAGPASEQAKAMGEHLAAAGAELARVLGGVDGLAEVDLRRAEVHRLENEVDHLVRVALGQLFAQAELPAAELLKWKDLYDLLERTMERCERAANLLAAIAVRPA
jgi:uncharacterized protein Yka (UPF0111/DUF47 family)